MNYVKILDGINSGDQIGGPFDLASVLIDCIKKNKNFNKENLRKMYQDWWNNGKFIIYYRYNQLNIFNGGGRGCQTSFLMQYNKEILSVT